MSELLQKNCSLCRLRSGCSQVVLPDAPKVGESGLFVVGEAPGRDEDEAGVGFVGSAGKKLDHILATSSKGFSITRNEYGRANVVCCRPPENRAPKRDEIAACSGWLRETLLERFDVRVVIAVGGVPSSQFYEGGSLYENIARARKSGFIPDAAWARGGGILVVPMPHTSPLAWNRNAPSGEKWSAIGVRQVEAAIELSVKMGRRNDRKR